MSFLRIPVSRQQLFSYVSSDISSTLKNGNLTNLFSSRQHSAGVTRPSCSLRPVLRGRPSWNCGHSQRNIHIGSSRAKNYGAKTITIVEYACEHQAGERMHVDLSNVLHSRIAQLDGSTARSLWKKENLTSPLQRDQVKPTNPTPNRAIESHKSASLNKKEIMVNKRKSVQRTKNIPKAKSATTGSSKKDTKSKNAESQSKTRMKVDRMATEKNTKRTKSIPKSSSSTMVPSKKDMSTKQKILVAKSKSKEAKGQSKSAKDPSKSRTKASRTVTERPNTTEKTKTRSKVVTGVRSENSSKQENVSSAAARKSSSSEPASLASSISSSISSVTGQSSIPLSSASSSLPLLLHSPLSSVHSSSASSAPLQSHLRQPDHVNVDSQSEQQLHNLQLAFGPIPPNFAKCSDGNSVKSLLVTSTIAAERLEDPPSPTPTTVSKPESLPHSIADQTRSGLDRAFSSRSFDLAEDRALEEELASVDILSGADPRTSNPVALVGMSTVEAKKERGTKWKKGRKKQFVENPDVYLRPFLATSVFSEHTETAQAMLLAFEKLNSSAAVDDYNTLIQSWARKGRWEEVRYLLARMSSKEVTSNTQTYASSLECLARCKDPDLKIVTKGLEQMEKDRISLDDMLTNSVFSGEGRQLVLDLVRRVRPSYEPPPAPRRPRCAIPIVHDLYSSATDTTAAPQDGGEGCAELMGSEDLERRIQQQWDMELAETVNVTSIEEVGEPDTTTAHRRALLAQHREQWRVALQRAVENEKTRSHFKFKNPNFGSMCYYPFLCVLPSDELAGLMLQSLSQVAATTEGSMTISLARDLASRLYRKYSIRSKLKMGNAKQIKQLYTTYVMQAASTKQADFQLPREHFEQLEDDLLGSSSIEQGFQASPWPQGMLIGIGTLLADMMLREIKIDANMHNSKTEKQWIPALYHMYTYRSFKHVGFIKPHPTLVDLFQTARDPNLEFDSNLLPMLTPPIPWTSVRSGAYPLSSTKIMRSKDGVFQHQDLLETTPPSELYPVLDALNQLSTVPWVINKPVLDAVVSVFRNNGSKELDIPQPASACPHPPRATSDVTGEELATIRRERAASRKLQAEMHSLRMDMLYKLSIADKFRDEIFWFPHNMDFRGRVYPCPPHFNHFGSDVTRSLLLFARGKPLGEEGFKWLQIHLVNLTGHKKRCSVADRLEYAEEMLPEIIDSADRPLNGNKWWQQSDEPWQTLASCIEVTMAIRSGNPAEFISHLPIHQDGSCNGLQHYAALGRDLIGAQQVNLHPYDTPQDVYSGVAAMVEELRVRDAQKGNAIAQALEGHVKRNVVKQTVMTVVYGVTSFGGRRQILKQLRDEDGLSTDQKWYAAGYLTLKVFQSLRRMFTKTREIQDWLTESAWLISKAGETVEWITPLGLPIVQPYHKRSLKLISQGGRNVYHEERHSQTERPDTLKQKNAFPPNFIHSLDSTHMMLTSLYSQRAGITFASVHDCYWTHACTVDVMNKICRSQFVKLHKEPILDNLADFLTDKYGQLEIQDAAKLKRGSRNMKTLEDYIKNVPEKGDFNLDNVHKSTYFFS